MNQNISSKGIQTQAVHAGESPEQQHNASVPPITMSSSFVVDQPLSFSATNLETDAEQPMIYTRWGNPTIAQLEEKLAALEKAESCVAFATGMAASSAVMLSLLNQGDHLIISNTNYPGTAELARDTLPRFGIEVSPIDTTSLQAIQATIQPNTKMIWVETPSNPLLRITDLAATAEIAHQNHALLVVDSTFATPVATRPLEFGADLVVHSLTKYIGGHGDALGGAVLGSNKLIKPLRGEGLIHYGGAISPFNAWLIMRGMATLPLRMRAHQENAMQIAQYLETHPKVTSVLYPGLASHPQHELAKQQMRNYSGMVCFTLDDPKPIAKRMMHELEVIHYAVSLGHTRSLIFLMESQDLLESSYRLNNAEREKYLASAGEGLFRFSAGIEDTNDLIADLKTVLGAVDV